METAVDSGGSLEAEAFRRLYPNQFYASFLAKQMRPDGRALMQSRPISVTPNAVSSADSSATAKLGDSAAIAGIKLEVAVPSDETPKEGYLAVGEVSQEVFLLHCWPMRYMAIIWAMACMQALQYHAAQFAVPHLSF